MSIHRSRDSYSPELTLHEFDWANLVEGRFFEQMLVGIIGVMIGLVSVGSETISVPDWVIIDPWLSGLCLTVGFARVWKTIREEHETAPLWDSVSGASSDNEMILDRVFEIPYLFTITLMPIAAIAPQLFMVVLFIFYVCDNFYNAALARGAEAPEPDQSYASALFIAVRRIVWLDTDDMDVPRRKDIVAYFRKRSRYDSALMALLLITFIGVFLALVAGERTTAWLLTLTMLLAILAFEVFVEPTRNRGMRFVPESDGVLSVVTIDDVSSRASVSDATAEELTEIHEAAFGPEEQQYTMADILHGAGLQDPLLRIVSLDGHVIGYLFLETAHDKATAFFWYIAITEEHRGGGIGAHIIRDTLRLLKSNDSTLKYVFFEVHRPGDGPHGTEDGTPDVNRRRIAFYRRLGAYWVRGVDYRIPAANDPSGSVAYEPMFFTLDGTFKKAEVVERIALMAEDNFTDDPGDERWVSMLASLKRATISAPDEDIAGY